MERDGIIITRPKREGNLDPTALARVPSSHGCQGKILIKNYYNESAFVLYFNYLPFRSGFLFVVGSAVTRL